MALSKAQATQIYAGLSLWPADVTNCLVLSQLLDDGTYPDAAAAFGVGALTKQNRWKRAQIGHNARLPTSVPISRAAIGDGGPVEAEVRERYCRRALRVLRKPLQREPIKVIHGESSFRFWLGSQEEQLDRIKTEWIEMGMTPTLADPICWFSLRPAGIVGEPVWIEGEWKALQSV